MPVIYIDVLFFINFILDSSLLFITSRLSGKSVHPFRIILGGLIGGIYSCSIFFLNIAFLSSIFIKIIASLLMLFVVFYPLSTKELGRILINFYIQTFLLGGLISAVFYFSGRPAVMSNNIYYFPFSTMQLFIIAIPLVITLAFYWKRSKNRLLSYGKYCRITICYNNKSVVVEGLIDSGCSLTDPLSGKPVVILNASFSSSFFNKENVALIKNNNLASLLISGNFRLIPFSTVSSQDNNMIGFLPDKCIVEIEEKTFLCDCVIAFTSSFSAKTAIINPDIFSHYKYFGGNINEL